MMYSSNTVNIGGSSSSSSNYNRYDRAHRGNSSSSSSGGGGRSGEHGYTLVGLLALMAIMVLLFSAAAPNIRQQNRRQLEREAIYRGEEVADAIREYARARGGALPSSMDQLLEGVPVGSKKKQILRASAARDPLTTSGEWRTVQPNDAKWAEFKQAVTVYAGGQLPQPRENWMTPYATPVVNILNTGTTASLSASGGEDDSVSSSGPFVGVISRSRRPSVLTYYGIDRHNAWVFTPLFR